MLLGWHQKLQLLKGPVDMIFWFVFLFYLLCVLFHLTLLSIVKRKIQKLFVQWLSKTIRNLHKIVHSFSCFTCLVRCMGSWYHCNRTCWMSTSFIWTSPDAVRSMLMLFFVSLWYLKKNLSHVLQLELNSLFVSENNPEMICTISCISFFNK